MSFSLAILGAVMLQTVSSQNGRKAAVLTVIVGWLSRRLCENDSLTAFLSFKAKFFQDVCSH